MAKPDIEINDQTYTDMIEIMVEYRRGIQNLEGAMKRMEKITGLTKEICRAMLSNLTSRQHRQGATDIRGYQRTPKHLVDGKMRAKAARVKKLEEIEARKLSESSRKVDES